MNSTLQNLVENNLKNRKGGIYSVCSSNEFVIKAAMAQALKDKSMLLIESTSNQVDQYGGYSGMTPTRFVEYVRKIATEENFPSERIILGGDHLGPNAWQKKSAETAMKNASILVSGYVFAGYKKIHLDASMRCADDDSSISPKVIAKRTAQLCKVAEDAGKNDLYYVIGSEVPLPGGAQEKLNHIKITNVVDVEETIELTKKEFYSIGLQSAWDRVIAIVVQPGVEFGQSEVFYYDKMNAIELSKFIEKFGQFVYEAHSTDFQKQEALNQLVEDHFAILKVGPWFTFAFREAIFALAEIEKEIFAGGKNTEISDIKNIVDIAMQKNLKYWQNHYDGAEKEIAFARKYSYSDRIRYYWPDGSVRAALSTLLNNLLNNSIPLSLLSQYLPNQYDAVKEGRISNLPTELIKDKIMEITKKYAIATNSFNDCNL